MDVVIALGGIKKKLKMKIFNWLKNLFSEKKVKKSSRPITDDQFNENRVNKQKKLDKILEKIYHHGYDSLSTHEKNFLENYNN